jgi:mevalonate kinase
MNKKRQQVTASAPGKLMLLGEHAVVYGRPCLVTAVGRWQATVAPTTYDLLHVTAPDVGLFDCTVPLADLGKALTTETRQKPVFSGENGFLSNWVKQVPVGARFIATAVQEFRQQHGGSGGLRVSTSSHFSSRYGLGSSAAVTVAVLQALAALHRVPLTQAELFDLGRRAVRAVQGVGSGFDVAAAVYGGTLYFATGGQIIEPLAVDELPLVVGYSGVKADTSTLVRGVAARRDASPQEIDRLFDNSAALVEMGRQALQAGDFVTLGSLCDQAQELLVRLGVSTPRLETLIAAARAAGVWGAKLSGAGGGDCLIALAPAGRRQAVEAAIVAAGGEVVAVRPGEPGARVEEVVG